MRYGPHLRSAFINDINCQRLRIIIFCDLLFIMNYTNLQTMLHFKKEEKLKTIPAHKLNLNGTYNS